MSLYVHEKFFIEGKTDIPSSLCVAGSSYWLHVYS